VNATTQSVGPFPYHPQQSIPQAALPQQGLVSCRTCFNPHRAEARFCTHCGHATIVNEQTSIPQTDSTPHAAPIFAHVNQVEIPKELLQELGDLLTLLIRERLFLIFHCTAFLGLTLIGVWLSLKVYNGFVGDEVTRVILALTPLLFINCTTLGIIAPIMGTKREIQKLKYRLLLVRHRIEYRAIL
jgi:hypothetical protein